MLAPPYNYQAPVRDDLEFSGLGKTLEKNLYRLLDTTKVPLRAVIELLKQLPSQPHPGNIWSEVLLKACVKDRVDIVEYLFTHKKQYEFSQYHLSNALADCVRGSNIQTLDYLIKSTVYEQEYKDYLQISSQLFTEAAHYNQPNILTYIYQNFENQQKEFISYNNYTALKSIVSSENVPMITVILKHHVYLDKIKPQVLKDLKAGAYQAVVEKFYLEYETEKLQKASNAETFLSSSKKPTFKL